MEPEACPTGAWCPAESALPYANKCPNGTFSDALMLSSESECTPCTPGFYCGEAGLTSPSGKAYVFDARANGFVRGEACGTGVMQVAEAEVSELLVGSAVRQDGRSASLTAPNGSSQ